MGAALFMQSRFMGQMLMATLKCDIITIWLIKSAKKQLSEVLGKLRRKFDRSMSYQVDFGGR